MKYELKHYCRVKYALVCAKNSFLKEPPKDDFEKCAREQITPSKQARFYNYLMKISPKRIDSNL